MKVAYGIRAITSYEIVREYSDDTDRTGGTEHVAVIESGLESAEKLAKALSDLEPGSTWYTVPQGAEA